MERLLEIPAPSDSFLIEHIIVANGGLRLTFRHR
jgi:hypothetical protein